MNFEKESYKYLDYVKVTKSLGYYNFELDKVQRLNLFFKKYNVNDITKDDVISFINNYRLINSEITNNTINKHVGCLKRIYKYSTSDTLIFSKLTEVKKIVTILSDDDIVTIHNYYSNKLGFFNHLRNYLLINLILDTGLRINEAKHLKINDIDIGEQSIHVKVTKTHKERYVFFKQHTKDLLIRYISTYSIKNYLFIDYKSKVPLKSSTLQTISYRIKKDVNIEVFRWHVIRHTFATKFHQEIGDTFVLQSLLGHSDIKTTQIYVHNNYKFLKDSYFNEK